MKTKLSPKIRKLYIKLYELVNRPDPKSRTGKALLLGKIEALQYLILQSLLDELEDL